MGESGCIIHWEAASSILEMRGPAVLVYTTPVLRRIQLEITCSLKSCLFDKL